MSESKCKNAILSVIVPVCNVEKFLRECMDSIVNQEMQDIEVICINDGSTDSSLEILREYEKADSRIKVIDKANAGYGAAMNDGLDAATGQYLTILESDDFCTKNGWKKLVDLCIEHDLDIAKGCYYRHSDEDEFFKVYEKTDVHCPPWMADIPTNIVFEPRGALRVFWMTPSIWSCVYRRSFLVDNDIRFNETPGASFQDTGFFFGTWSTASRAMIVDDAILHYRIDNSASSSKSTKKVHAVREEMDFAKKYLLSREVDVIFLQVLCSIRYKTYLWNIKRIADDYIEEFEKEISADMLSDLEDGCFSPLLFNKRDGADFLERACKNSNGLDLNVLQYQFSPKVSILVPCDEFSSLKRRLKAIEAQAYENIEVICIIIEGQHGIEAALKLCEKDDRFNKIVSSEIDEGLIYDALLLSHGDYVLFADREFELTKLAVKRLAGAAYTNDLNLVFFRCSDDEDELECAGQVHVGQDVDSSILSGLESARCSVLFKKDPEALDAIAHDIFSRRSKPSKNPLLGLLESTNCRSMLIKSKNPLVNELDCEFDDEDASTKVESKPNKSKKGFFRALLKK